MLRPYQQDCLDSILREYKAGVRQQLCVLSTGTGKTVIAASLPELFKNVLPGKMLFVAHRNELLIQTIEKLHTWAPTLKVGLEKAEQHADLDSDVIVASIASVGRSGSTRLAHFWDHISIIVIDEVHHVCSEMYRNMLEDSGVLREDSTKLLVGITATPRRRNLTRKERKETLLDDEDIVSLKSFFKKIVYSFPIREAIKQKYLVPLRGYRVATQTNLENVKTIAGDFQQDQLSTAVNTPDRNLQIVKAWKDYAETRQTVWFTVDIAHAKALAGSFQSGGFKFEPIWGNDPDRAEKLAKYEAKEINGLCNCALLIEGWDSPVTSCIGLAAPTKSPSKMTQQIGRGTRLYPGKDDCVIIDVVDVTKKNSIVTLPSLLGLAPDFNLHGESVTKAAEKLETLQDKYPGIDFTKLTDLSSIKAYVESIDIFAEPYTEEVKEFSHLTWMATQGGSYVLSIPEKETLSKTKNYAKYLHEKLHITPNALDEFELSISTVETDRKLGTYNTLKEAFESADDVIRRCRYDRIKLMVRDALWHGGPASEPAKKYLRTLTKSKPLPYCLCVGQGAPDGICAVCHKKTGITAGQAATALNILKSKG